MSDADVERLLEGYRSLNRGDLGAVLELLDPEIEWYEPDPSPEAGLHHGRDGFARFLAGWLDSFEDFRVEPERIAEQGDRIVVTVRQSGRGRASGLEVTARLAHVWTISGGRAVGWRSFGDPAQAEAGPPAR
ncbi:MAG: nuclear transport factor 2 family protein [Solirubrobacterales bacterium]